MNSMLNSGCGTMRRSAVFAGFGLDVVDGAVRKPDSLFAGAIRK